MDEIVPAEIDTTDHSTFYNMNVITSQEEHFIKHLFLLEERHKLTADYKRSCTGNSDDATLRENCIRWILEIHNGNLFHPVDALISINYCDRVLSLQNYFHNIGINKPKKDKLMSVVCVSLAAKLETNNPPSPLAMLQKLEPSYVLDEGEYRKMEIDVIKTLKWELRSVTPFDFLPYSMSMLHHLDSDDIKRTAAVASDIFIETAPGFLEYAPSVVAAAAVLSAASYQDVEQIPSSYCFFRKVDKEIVKRCLLYINRYRDKWCK